MVDVRGRGLTVGVELASAGVAARLREELLERFVIVSTCGPDSGSLRIAPPLIVNEGHVLGFLAACGEALRAL